MAIVLAIGINPLTAGCFVVGATLSATAGYIGMTAATMANVRTTNAAKNGDGSGIPGLVLQRHGHGADSRRSRAARALGSSFMS